MAETAKQTALELIQRLPDDVTLEDIMYELYVIERIEQGLKDAAEGRTVPHEEVRKSVLEWLRSAGQ